MLILLMIMSIKLNTSKSFLQTNGLDIRWFDGPKYWQRHLIGTHVDPPIRSPKKFLGTQITKELMTYINEGLLSRNKLLQHVIGNKNGITSHPQGIDTPKKDVMNHNSPHLTHRVQLGHPRRKVFLDFQGLVGVSKKRDTSVAEA